MPDDGKKPGKRKMLFSIDPDRKTNSGHEMALNSGKDLIEIAVELETNGRFIANINVQVTSNNAFINKLMSINLEGEHFGFDFTGDFSSIPNEIKNFLLSYKSYQLNLIQKIDNFTIRITSPVDFLFFDKLLSLKPRLILHGKSFYPEISQSYYPLKIEMDDSAEKLVLNDKNDLYLIQTTAQDFVFDLHKVYPVLSLFNKDLSREIFVNGFIPADYEIKLKLLFQKSENKEWMNHWFKLPEVKEFSDENIIFYFEHGEKENFVLKAFFSVKTNGKWREYPFLFDEIRKSALLHEDIIIPINKDTVYICKAGTDFYNRVAQIGFAVKNHFFEILNEVNGNIISTPDNEALFQKFLPAIQSYAEIRGVNSNIKMIHGTFDEKKIVLSYAKDNDTPRIDWLEVGFQFKIQDIVLTLNELSQLSRNGFVQKGNIILSVNNEDLTELKEFLLETRLKKNHDKIYISKYNIPYLLREGINLQLPQDMRNLPAEMDLSLNRKKALQEVLIPDGLSGILREYQKTGVYWLNFLNRYGFGGILADEMGLGKTIQVLTYLLINKRIRKSGGEDISGPLDNGLFRYRTALIVCPTALLYNWVGEIQKFIGTQLSYIVIDGNKAERAGKIKEINNYDIAITSYQMVHNDSEEYKNVQFFYCILDEAQHIKNKQAKRTLSVKGIHAANRLAVTGTPIENNIAELWSIFDFLMPDFLGTHIWFKKYIENPLNSFNNQEKNKTMDRLKKLVKPFILRRIKVNVLKELPPKIEQDVELELTEAQKAVYLDTLSQIRNNLFKIVEVKGLENSYIDFLSALTRLRQICLHPGLINSDYFNVEDISIKLKALMELVYESIDSGHRVAVFSQFVEMLKIIRKELHNDEIEYLYLDGQTKNRVDLVNHFNQSDIPLFLISLKAGGTGLNLIGADSVILFDPWWNPAVENQAIDRVHRIGQVSTVNVYRLITKGTIEEKIKRLQVYKKEVFDNLIASNQSFIKNMKWQDIKNLFELESNELKSEI